MWLHNSNGRSKFFSRRLSGAAAQSCERPFGTSLILRAVHIFDPFLSRFAGFEGISEILCLVCNLCSVERHYAHGVEGLIIVCQDILTDPQIAASHDSMHQKALFVRLQAPGGLYIVSPDDSLPGLRIIEDCIFLIDVVLRRKIAGVGCRPMLIQCLPYFLISHATVLRSAGLIVVGNAEFADGARRAPKDNPTLSAIRLAAEAPPGFGQELQSTESKSKEPGERIEDIPTVKES